MGANDREIERLSAEVERLRAHADLIHRIAGEAPEAIRGAMREVADREPLSAEDVDALALWNKTALVAGLVDELLAIKGMCGSGPSEDEAKG